VVQVIVAEEEVIELAETEEISGAIVSSGGGVVTTTTFERSEIFAGEAESWDLIPT